ncbi:predicted protein [Scheffersomyces stipitis CBS 6054]|uniref:Uncharacterized protein n=1 Tax=Scheffersomyces stipitis (strain ATCC 58785 / CBS 6054 / NBRC 10063 / NRRL Y-11545) TaxID=322104 RepID=A3GHV2_PICST|nr:predicted protein [Scheffersomyces stipitis CBS 6054]EAZ62881.2 predicted protein [Scheffersomyces stipitis CBS 6054]KAG2735481.1 hypothetical protein G9P44_001695 [Scheffersomyces stipitis]
MVVRSTLRAMISKVPYSDKIPDAVSRLLDEGDSYTYRDRISSVDYEFDRSRSLSPKDRIHSKLISNRLRDTTTTSGVTGTSRALNIVDEIDEIEYERMESNYEDNVFRDDGESTISYLNYCDTCDAIPVDTKLAINKLNDNGRSTGTSRSNDREMGGLNLMYQFESNSNMDEPLRLGDGLSDRMNPFVDASETTLVSEGSMHQHNQQQRFGAAERNLRTKQYLSEQNNKFDELISNNLNVVLKKYEVEEKVVNPFSNTALVKLLYQNTTEQITSRIPFGQSIKGWLPWIDKPQPKELPKEIVKPKLMVLPEPEFIATSTPQDDVVETFQEEEYDRDISVELFIDSLDPETKANLLSALRKDSQDEETDVEEPKTKPKQESTIDKLQAFLIISIKLFITGFKLSIPFTKYIYQKFKNNELFVINYKNVNKFFDLLLQFMNYLDGRLNRSEDVIEKLYQQKGDNYYNDNFDIIYQEISQNVSNYMNEQMKKVMRSVDEDKSMKGIVARYLVAKYLPIRDQKTHMDMSDPKYSIYFSASHNSQPGTLASGSPQSITPESMHNSDSINSDQISLENLEDLSVLKIAQRFVDELGP